jgi:hypothetical protein
LPETPKRFHAKLAKDAKEEKPDLELSLDVNDYER